MTCCCKCHAPIEVGRSEWRRTPWWQVRFFGRLPYRRLVMFVGSADPIDYYEYAMEAPHD